MRALVASVLLVTALPIVPAADAQANPDGFKRCGDPGLVLVFMNPDLKARPDGYIHASGSFFIQFQARGPKAMEIETLKFSFGPDVGIPDNCNDAEHVTGAYVKNYRADYDWKDGFFIPIDTCLVQDNTWAVAISAYNKDQKELVRYYAKAKVDNGGRQTNRDPCDKKDFTAPWPMVLPGDGERFDRRPGLYVEVGEPIESLDAFVNGKRLQLEPAEAPPRDNDLVPDLGYTKELRDSPLAHSQVQSRVYGPAFHWDGDLVPGDVVKVRVTDKWGNLAEKVVHLGDPTIGGRVTGAAPDFDLRVPVTDLTADANGTAVYNVTYLTKNDEGLHADLYVHGPDGAPLAKGLDYRLDPNHVMMAGNRQLDGKITLFATKDAKPGVYQAIFVANYLHGDARREKAVPLTFRVDAPPEPDAGPKDEIASRNRPNEQERVAGDRIERTAAANPPVAAPQETPGVAPFLLLATLALLALRRRRRT